MIVDRGSCAYGKLQSLEGVRVVLYKNHGYLREQQHLRLSSFRLGSVSSQLLGGCAVVGVV